MSRKSTRVMGRLLMCALGRYVLSVVVPPKSVACTPTCYGMMLLWEMTYYLPILEVALSVLQHLFLGSWTACGSPAEILLEGSRNVLRQLYEIRILRVRYRTCVNVLLDLLIIGSMRLCRLCV